MNNIVITNIATGYETDKIPPIIPVDGFPFVENAYFWRGSVKRRRGTELLGRLQRTLTEASLGTTSGAGSLSVNILTHLALNSAPQTNSSISTPIDNLPFTGVSIVVGADTFTDTNPPTGVLTGSAGGTGTINYQTGALILTGAPINTAVTITFSYFPDLPVLGLEDFEKTNTRAAQTINFPDLVAFDQSYAYQFTQPNGPFYDVTFYKSTKNPFVWTGQNYEQFYSANWQGAMWVTNSNPGFHFMLIDGITPGNPTSININAHGLSDNDYVFINEVVGTMASTINGFSGIVTVVDANNFTIDLDTTGLTYVSGGIAEYLTSSSPQFGLTDGIRWYDGDPTRASAPNNKGFVNFAPPLSNAVNPEYLVGAKIIVPFKNRLLFFGTFTCTSAGVLIFNNNQVIYSEDGTAYYSLPIPDNQIEDFETYFSNVAGKGGFVNAPLEQEIVGVGINEDLLIVTFETRPLKLISRGDDSFPFSFQTISPELGQTSTFSTIPIDKGILGVGPYGWTLTTANSVDRFDLKILDEVFNLSVSNNGDSRVTAVRDYRNELVYFTICYNDQTNKIYPNATLVYNYRELNWGFFFENYTHYGTFRRSQGLTWATLPYRTWTAWTTPWNSGVSNMRYPFICAGNQQGFVLLRGEAKDLLGDDYSNYIQAVSGLTITSPDHNMSVDDYILFANSIGVDNLNGTIRKVFAVVDENTFMVDNEEPLEIPTGTYIGGGTFFRLNRFDILTKMFPVGWAEGNQARLSVQRFLLDTTAEGQIEVDIYTNQSDDEAVNDPINFPYLPFTNLMPTYAEEFQNPDSARLWHRMSNSFSGDTIQIGFTLSDAQMRDINIVNSEFRLHAVVITTDPSSVLA